MQNNQQLPEQPSKITPNPMRIPSEKPEISRSPNEQPPSEKPEIQTPPSEIPDKKDYDLPEKGNNKKRSQTYTTHT